MWRYVFLIPRLAPFIKVKEIFNPLKRSNVRWLHLEVFSAIQI